MPCYFVHCSNELTAATEVRPMN